MSDRLDAGIAERRLSDAVTSLADEIGAETAFAAGRLAELLRQQRTVDPWRWHDPYRRATRKRRRAWLGSDWPRAPRSELRWPRR